MGFLASDPMEGLRVRDADLMEHDPVPGIVILAALAVVLLALGLFLRTLHPGVGPSLDSIELQIAALVRGVIHPPGSPQYLILGRLVMDLPLGGDEAFRLNLFSAASAALAVGLVFLTAYRMTRNLAASIFSAGLLALSARLWYQASIAELYALNALYVAAVAYLLLAWHQTRQPVVYWAAASIYALSFGNHLSMILLLPAYLYMVNVVDRTILTRPRNLAFHGVIVVVAALQYLYIPLHAGAPFCNFCPGTPEGDLVGYLKGPLIDYLTGGPFKGALLAVPRSELLARLPESIGQINTQFLPWGYMLGIVGVWELFKRRSELAWFLVLAIVSSYLFVISYNIPDWHDFMTPVYVLFTPLISYGVLRLWQLLEPQADELHLKGRLWAARAYPIALVLVGTLMLGFSWYVHLPQVDQSRQGTLISASEALLEHAAPDALFLMPRPSSPSFIYSWAVRYTAFATDLAPGLRVVAPPEVDPPPGPAPYYVRWADAAPFLSPDALLRNRPEVYVADWADDRLEGWQLLPICTDRGHLAGYRVVAVLIEGEPHPIVDDAAWEAAQPYLFNGKGQARCPK